MKLTLHPTGTPGIAHISAEGSITAADLSADGTDPLQALLGSDWARQRVLLDLSAVSYIDSSAIGWLIDAQHSLQQAGGRLVVHSLRPNVRQILEVLKIGRVVAIADDEPAAREMLSDGPTRVA
jgi:anti-anti-sigma factor